jgi:N-acetylglucosaminyl-diphospho-decaprenol L-rhamnosyltransferase
MVAMEWWQAHRAPKRKRDLADPNLLSQSLMADTPDLDFETVVVTYNSVGHIRPCLRSLQPACTGIVVVDNGSSDNTQSVVQEEFPAVRLIPAGRNLGYGKALNLGIAQTRSSFVVAANADTIFPESSLQLLARFLASHSTVGVVGPQELFPDGSWQRSYGDVPGVCEGAKTLIGLTSVIHVAERMAWRCLPSRGAKPVGYVDGAVMMIRRAAFDAIGGFDDEFRFYCEDADFCLRLRQGGWGVANVPAARVFHTRGGSSTKVEGLSYSLLRTLAIAEGQLIRKHCPAWHLTLYCKLCILHARKMSLLYRLLGMFSSDAHARRADAMMSAFERWARVWKELEA